MSDYKKHIELVNEKLIDLIEAYKKKRSSVVGDLGTKVVEQLVEADLAKNNVHLTKHYDRHQYMNKTYPKEVNIASTKIWRAYTDLGYDGLNGGKAKIVVHYLKTILKFFEERLNERFNTEEHFKETN
ncbi:MAG: hypothetical protein JW871_02545 [Endomicrobiales bacterium]|nr:hypothetical protein [Endomicrobiales bacterium]